MKEVFKKQIEIYVEQNGQAPFINWLESLSPPIRARVKERLDRVTLGNLGDYKKINKDILELRLSFGPGYRIYFYQKGNKIILLLSGGDKSTQKKDIKKAINYLNDYLSE
ncbi:MAG: type II toxin-antitoxin system RelE/ParE family toxin [Pseudomonadota bacterium]